MAKPTKTKTTRVENNSDSVDLLAGFSQMACPCGKSMQFELWWKPNLPATYRVKCSACGFIGPEHSIKTSPK